jgi:hypothetical protein
VINGRDLGLRSWLLNLAPAKRTVQKRRPPFLAVWMTVIKLWSPRNDAVIIELGAP